MTKYKRGALPLWVGVEYAHCIPAYVRPDGSASTAWDYASLLCNFYRDAGQKRCHDSQTSRA